MYLQNYLLKHNIPSTIIDTKPEKLSPKDFKHKIRSLQPKIIGFTGSPFERHTLHDYIKGLKKYSPASLIVAGGPYFTATAKECLCNLTDVDVVVKGEGEVTLYELVRKFESGADFTSINGIVFKGKNGELVETSPRSMLNRDDCEVDVELIRNDQIYSPFVNLKNFEKEQIKAIPILISRGCVKKCTYCFNNNSRFRSRSIDSIIREIQLKRKLFNNDYFWMVDPTFTLREKYSFELCEALKKHCAGIKWYCETRADCNLELLEKMAEAGCISIDFALETGSSKVLKAIRKDLDPALTIPFAKKAKQLGIRALAFVMYSLPKETYADFLMTMEMLHKLQPYLYDISFARTLILPGTQLEQQARNEGLLPDGFCWYDEKFPSIPGWEEFLSKSEISECREMLTDYRNTLHMKNNLNLEYYIQKIKRYIKLKEPAKAEQYLKLIPHKYLSKIDLLFLYNFAGVLRDSENLPSAASYYKKIILSKGKRTDLKALSHFQLGSILNSDKKYSRAKYQFNKCLKLMPEHQKARDLLNQISAH